jgi:hypothetical protein
MIRCTFNTENALREATIMCSQGQRQDVVARLGAPYGGGSQGLVEELAHHICDHLAITAAARSSNNHTTLALSLPHRLADKLAVRAREAGHGTSGEAARIIAAALEG